MLPHSDWKQKSLDVMNNPGSKNPTAPPKDYPYSFNIADSGNSANMMVVRALVVYSTKILPSLT